MNRLAALLLAAAILAPSPSWAKGLLLYSGSYTTKESKGIYAWRFDSKSGALSPLGLVAEAPQPAHIWAAPNGRFLYAVNWEQEGGVSAFSINQADGKLTLINRVSAEGALPNQIVLDPSGRIAITVNYTTGNLAAYKIERDGSLSKAFYVDQHTGKPLSERQPGPKAHGVVFTKNGRYMYVAELGLDRVYAYEVDARRAVIKPVEPAFVNTHAGAGPRRLQLSPNDRFLYVNHETDSEVSVFTADRGKLTEIQTIKTLPAGYTERNSTAEIEMSPDGRYLYVGNRGHDSIAIFAVDKATGKLTLTANAPAGGRTPRNLRFDPSGNFLVSANENGGNLVVFRVDKQSGALTPVGAPAEISTPGGMYFVATK